MREIKFRGKRVDNGEWVVGYLVPWNNKSYESKERMCIRTGIVESFEVNPETVGQFTELFDKANNPIIENDIWKERDSIGIIRYRPGEFYIEWIVNNGFYNEWIARHADNGVVIGNITDNPELLTVQP